jgi:hypothetical protein
MEYVAPNAAQAAPGHAAPGQMVRQFHQSLIWPVQVLGDEASGGGARHWMRLFEEGDASVWTEIDDEFTRKPGEYQERSYREFVAFLPHVQRFLYGERGRGAAEGYGESPIRVFRRSDVRKARCRLPGGTTLELDVARCDLHFFFDVDVVIFSMEVKARDLPLPLAQEVMLRFGRAYPGGWGEDGAPQNCFEKVEWLGEGDAVLSVSDYECREKYFNAVSRNQTAAIATHWAFMLRPLVQSLTPDGDKLRFRQLEYHRMPLTAYLALDDVTSLTLAQQARICLVAPPGDTSPVASPFLQKFEERFCYDRYWEPGRENWTNTRLMCNGHAVVALGEANKAVFVDPERGFLGQFRHQLFLVALIAHFHRAALLMLSDRLVTAMSRLDIADAAAVRRFRRDVRINHEVFLRFTHRYYFSEVSDQAVARDLFKMMIKHLEIEKVYAELREEIHDMSHYLETDMLRRQAVTILRLTVVTLFSLVGNVTTGFLGMNLFSYAEQSPLEKTAIFLAVFVPATALTFYTVMKSQRLSLFLDAFADERLGWGAKFKAFVEIWRKKPRGAGG